MKCEYGVERGWLEKDIRDCGDQSTYWVYNWTEKAKEEFLEQSAETTKPIL